jgi:hypothetical protein
MVREALRAAGHLARACRSGVHVARRGAEALQQAGRDRVAANRGVWEV